MTTHLDCAFTKNNLLRAWRWINSNSEQNFKNYFRDIYSSYSIAYIENIEDLQKRLKNNTYIPSKPVKIYRPKKSGGLRPITLLSIEDQIVYQAFVNIIAEFHYKKHKNKYLKTSFGNLFAGTKSVFFYRKWQGCYKEMNKQIKRTFNNGYNYSVSFDLTACFDSIDHKVLQFFLEDYRVEKEFIDRFLYFLSTWTTDNRIIQGAGIPQGPLGSGLIAEIVLSYFDDKYLKNKFGKEAKYFRYVDDIRIFSKSEKALRANLVSLEYYSKQIGLYPQSSKIKIKKVLNINEELKSLSLPEVDTENNESFSTDLNKEIFSLIEKNHVTDTTKFRMLLHFAKYNYKLTNKLLSLFETSPELYETICKYLSLSPNDYSKGIFNKIMYLLDLWDIYPEVSSTIIESTKDNFSNVQRIDMYEYAKSKWGKDGKQLKSPRFTSIIIGLLMENSFFKYNQLDDLISHTDNWLVLKNITKYIDYETLGAPSYEALIEKVLNNNSIDVSLVAAHELIKKNSKNKNAYKNANHIAQKALKFSGVIKRGASTPSVINYCIDTICKETFPNFNWKKVFGKDHNEAENKIVRAHGYAQNDMSAFVNMMDVFNDLLLSKLFKHDISIGNYNLGKIGGVLELTNKKFRGTYPELWNFCKHIHEKRLMCDLSHPVHKSSQTYTKPIPYKSIYELRKFMISGYKELISKW